MAIAASDLKLKFSVSSGTAGNSTSSSGAAALGKFISTTELTSGLVHNLFAPVGAAENTASGTKYRCVVVHNAHASLTAQGVVVWISAEVAGGASVALAVDSTGASAIGSSSAQALQVANEDTAPSGLTFSAPTTRGTGLAIGDLAPGQCRAIWIRRAAANTAAIDNDGCTLSIGCNSAA